MALPANHSPLAIVIVSWNTRDLLRRCLHAVAASLADSGIPYRVLVVDNASHDGTPAMIRAEFSHVFLLEAGRNLGFVGGNNLALQTLGFGSAAGKSPPPDYVLLLNPDTEPVGDALPRLVRHLDAHPDLVAVGPLLRYADGSIQSSRRRFPTRLAFFWESTLLERCWPRNPWAAHYRMERRTDPLPTEEQRCGWLVGAALLVRGAAITRAGLLDERFFLYSEELEWQHRLQPTTAPTSSRITHHSSFIAYLPQAVVIHHEGQSSEQVPLTRHLHFQRSKLLLAQMWYGTGFAASVRGFIRLCYLYDLLSEAGKHLLGHRRALRRQRIAVYAALLGKL